MAGSGKLLSESSSARSQKATVADLSIIEKLDTIPTLLTVLANTFIALFTRALRPTEPASYYNYVNMTALRTFVRRASVRQLQYLTPPTDNAYEVICKKRGRVPNSLILEDGTRAHWIGSSKAEKLIVNFHGGGYVLPCSESMLEFVFQVVEVLTAQGNSVAAIALSYDLAPGAIYPRQLQQAATLLNHLLQNLNYEPHNIILTGDSAGANLVTSLLSHILHPHPSGTIPAVDLGGRNFAAAVLTSPWIDFNTERPSFTRNKYKDCVGLHGLRQFSTAFLNEPYPHTAKLDNYNQALLAPESWWEGLPVDKVLVLAGEEEVLVDGIRQFAEKLKKGVGEGRVDVFVAKGEYHDEPSIDLALGYKESEEREQAKLIKKWIGSHL